MKEKPSLPVGKPRPLAQNRDISAPTSSLIVASIEDLAGTINR